MGFPGSSDGRESDCNVGDLGSIPGLGRSPREGNGYPFQYSCLENSMDRGAWQATVSSWDRKESGLTEWLTLSLSYITGGFPGDLAVKNLPVMQETQLQSLGQEDPLEKGYHYPLQYSWTFLVAQLVKNLPAMWETWVQSLGWEDPLEKRKTTHSSVLAWRIPGIVHV